MTDIYSIFFFYRQVCSSFSVANVLLFADTGKILDSFVTNQRNRSANQQSDYYGSAADSDHEHRAVGTNGFVVYIDAYDGIFSQRKEGKSVKQRCLHYLYFLLQRIFLGKEKYPYLCNIIEKETINNHEKNCFCCIFVWCRVLLRHACDGAERSDYGVELLEYLRSEHQ